MRLAVNQPFDLATLTAGQAFRWNRGKDGWYTGVIKGDIVRIGETANGDIEFRCSPSTETDMLPHLKKYFRLGDNIEGIYADIIARDERMIPILDEFWGLRLLRQDPWECMVAYICSARSSIESIQSNLDKIAKAFGREVTLDGYKQHTFPTYEDLACGGEESLQELKLGFRAPYIYQAALSVQNGTLEFEALQSKPCVEATRLLEKNSGIGLKIANCIAGFSLEKLDAFPVDRWVRRALMEFDFPSQESDLALTKRARKRYGPYAAYVNQYLFNWIRYRHYFRGRKRPCN